MRHLAAYVLAFAAFVPFNAGAAPQILGLIATAEPVPLTCEDGVCQAEFSSVCLQRDRDMPKDGTVYNLTGDQVTLVITGKDGSIRRIPAANWVDVRSAETYTAVIIAIPRDFVGPDAERIAISVDRMAAAVPVAEAGDPNPLTEDETALVTGPKLKIAERTISQKPRQTASARITMRMINAAEKNPSRFVDDLWREAAVGEAANSKGAIRAAGIVRMCRLMEAAGHAPVLRDCLFGHHHGTMLDLTSQVWNRLGAGS
jgi:hypothetical protein